ncbi:triacylglycerol lipase 2-like [Impatiens glandulifera]|uniref:triacylglycerol lipase 2-like n=1 Tax=Impatiens glandulifera TaxID=253017 RepID=UPI001FB08C5E|nr:triacylglycerol lipase 2-like [Impatiens glandulifera]
MVVNWLRRLAILISFSLVLDAKSYNVFGFSVNELGQSLNITQFLVDHSEGICATFIRVHGYQCGEFEVTTNDGYILSLQRMKKEDIAIRQKQPILLQHGLVVDGTSWLLNAPDENLPMILADSGFDVWISNTRGTQFSQKHVSLNVRDKEYWNWSWEELASYDLPAVVDFIFGQTGKKLNYIGHSQGTLTLMTQLSERRLLDKLKSAVLLSPIARLSYMKTALVNFAARTYLDELVKQLGFGEIDPKGIPVYNMIKLLCDQPGIDCYDLVAAFTGKNCCLNSSTVDQVLKYELQPTSSKNLVHFAQIVRDGVVAKYDYMNLLQNIAVYGQPKPPVYDLSNIPNDFPLFLSYGGEDALSDVTDVKTLLSILGSHDVDKITVQFVEEYAHVDFIWGLSAKNVVYNKIVTFFKGDLEHNRSLYLEKKKATGKKNKDKNIDISYNVYGFTLALQVWTYEVIKTFVPKLVRNTMLQAHEPVCPCPRIIQYKSNRKSTAFDLHTALQGNIVKKMELSEEEKILYVGE